MRRFVFAAAAPLLFLNGAAHAQCTPEGNARFNAAERRIQAAAARIRAGDCAAVADWKRASADQRAILVRSSRQTYPYTCTVTFRNPPVPRCGGSGTAKAAAEKKLAIKTRPPEPTSATKSGETAGNIGSKSASCSDITGTSSRAPAATHCKDADRALYAARQIRQSNPKVAEAEYKKAAAAARRAGDTNLELNILREAVEPAASATIAAVAPAVPEPHVAAPPPITTPAPGSPAAAAPAVPAPHMAAAPPVVASAPASPSAGAAPRMWDGSKEKCDMANDTEVATAGWYDMCISEPVKLASAHRPNPDPMELGQRARQACGSYSRDTQQCFADFKLTAILAQNPGMREACEKKATERGLRQQLRDRSGMGGRDNRQGFLECVDNTYLYGSADGPPSGQSLRDMMRNMLDAASDPRRKRLEAVSSKRTVDPKDEAEYIEDFETRVKDAVTNAVALAVGTFGSAMPEREREACAAASLAAAHSVLTGGAPAVPEQCRAMANAARAHLAYYAHAHVDNSNSAMEDFLASFSRDLGEPLPGMTGLTPDDRVLRIGECLARGGTAETCN